MMEVDNLPVRSGGGELAFEPGELVAVGAAAIERKKPGPRPGQAREPVLGTTERVVAASAHVEAGVVDFAGIVMVADCRLERDAGLQEGPIRLLEFQLVVSRRVRAVDV